MKSVLRGVYDRVLSPSMKLKARDWILATQSFVHRLRNPGKRLTCNFCDYTAERFLPLGYDHPVLVEKGIIGGGHRPDGLCPRCHSSDRERLTKIVMEQVVNCSSGAAVFIVAPERNLYDFFRKQLTAKVFAGDIAPRFYDWAEEITEQDLTKLTYDDEAFDIVVCNHVLEHIPDDRKAMREILRVLKPGGYAMLGVPHSHTIDEIEEDLTIHDPEEQIRRFGQRDHVRIYTTQGYIDRLESVGFESHFKPAEDFVSLARHGLNPEESALLFRKSAS